MLFKYYNTCYNAFFAFWVIDFCYFIEDLLAIMPDENFRIGLCDDLPIVRQPDIALVIANQQFYAQELQAYADGGNF